MYPALHAGGAPYKPALPCSSLLRFLFLFKIGFVPASSSLSSKTLPSSLTGSDIPVEVHNLKNKRGVKLRTMNYGGRILSLQVPDRNGVCEDIVLGFSSPECYRSETYVSESPYFGAIIGRYSNRIEKGQFKLDGKMHQLTTNQDPHHLHGGMVGFDKRFWDPNPLEDEGTGIRYTYTSSDGEEGYPGRLETTVTYQLRDDNALVITYQASTTVPTPVNLTQHTYFNLAGHDNDDVLDHHLTINADRFTPVDSSLIPTGEIRPVEGTPFDFRQQTSIDERIYMENPQIRYAQGYDHNFVLKRDDAGTDALTFAACAYEPRSGRELTVHTTEPGMQFYTGNFLSGSLSGKDGAVYQPHSGFCLETQHFPNSPNEPDFPSTILRPGETYRSTTIYAFDVRTRTP